MQRAKNLAKKLNISKVVSTAKGSGLWFSDSSVYKDERIFAALDAFRNDAVLSPKAPPVVVFRNRDAEKGERFGKLAEGVATLKAVKIIADKANIDMPICQALYKVIYEDADIKATIREMFERDLKKEFDYVCA